MNTTCTTYTYTGDDQVIITVPSDAVGMTVKLWGAGGSREGAGKPDADFTAGCGGYTWAEFDDEVVRPGDNLTVVIPRGGYMWQTDVVPQTEEGFSNIPSGAGFGGVGDEDSGGGLCGVFTGGEALSATDTERALAVAGGGGSYDAEEASDAYDAADGSEGGNGNSPTSGGENGTMKGSSDAVLDGTLVDLEGNSCDTGWGFFGSSGGGGYEGGGRMRSVDPQYAGPTLADTCGYEVAAARGGKGYVDPRANTSLIDFTPDGPGDGLPPNTEDPDYVDGVGVKGNLTINEGGHGLAVVCWLSETSEPTSTPTERPTADPTEEPTEQPMFKPSEEPAVTDTPTATPTATPTEPSSVPPTPGSPESTDLGLVLALSILGLLLLCSSLIAVVLYVVKVRRYPPPVKTIKIQPMVRHSEEPVEEPEPWGRYSNGASRRWLTGAGVGGAIQSQSNHTQTVVFHTQQEEAPARTAKHPAAHHPMLYGSPYNPFPVPVSTTIPRVSSAMTGVRANPPLAPRTSATLVPEGNLQQLVLGGSHYETEGAEPRVSARLADMI